MPRFGLSLKIFLATAAIVTAVLVVTLVVTSRSARANAEASIDRGLKETNARIAEQLQARQKALATGLGVFFENRLVVTAILNDTSGNNAFDQSDQAREAVRARWVQIFDNTAVVLAKSDERNARGRGPSGSPLVLGALDGRTMNGFGVSGDTAIVELVTVPMLSNLNDARSIVGVVMAAQFVGDSLARTIGDATGSQVAFYVEDTLGAPHLAGATVPADDRAALQRAIADHLMKDTVAAGSTTSRDTVARTADTVAASMGVASRRSTIDIGGTTYVGQVTSLLSAANKPVGGFLAMRSLDAELTGYHALRRNLLITAAIGLIIAFLLSGAITRQIVRPVTALVLATRRAADGDYAAEIPAGSSDEIGTLADAVRRLLADLRDKQALVDFLGGGGAAVSTSTINRDADATQLLPGREIRSDGVLMPGQSLGTRYNIQALLGAGGMGMVYRAIDRELHEVVAIKTLKPEMLAADATALERFKGEIRLARKISHRNVVRTHDLGEALGLYFITMEFVEGTTLKDLVRQRGRLPMQVLLPIAKQLCRALEVAHEAGVIHRDIKPQNMVVERDGTLKVMDFGIARLAARLPQQGLTEAGMVIGTPEYMAPEQLLGEELDVRADIYAAGIVLYECLTGKLPFEAPTPIVLITRILEETPPTPHSLHSDIPVSISNLVMRAMSRERESRPQTAGAMHDTLAQIG